MSQQQHKFETLEQAAFNLFRKESTSDYKRFVIRLVHEAVSMENGITVNKLKTQLKRSLLLHDSDIEAAIASLTNDKLFDCLSKFEVPSKKLGNSGSVKPIKPVHLRKKNDCSAFWSEWIARIDEHNPEVAAGLLLVR